MDYDDIKNPKLKAIIDGLKYNSSSIEQDLLQAFEEAEDEEEFIQNAKVNLNNISDEAMCIHKSLDVALNSM